MNKDELKKIGLSLDAIEAELVGMQARIYSIRLAISKAVGQPIGYQYDVKYTPVEADARD